MKQDIGKEIADMVRLYTDEIKVEVEKAALDVTQSTVALLKDTSPKNTGVYAKGWGREKQKKGGYLVRQKKKPSLTHLLEKGHAKVNGGRVAGVPHIFPAEEIAVKEFERRVNDVIRKAGD